LTKGRKGSLRLFGGRRGVVEGEILKCAVDVFCDDESAEEKETNSEI